MKKSIIGPPFRERIENAPFERNDKMEIDIRKHPQIRNDVHAGLTALRVQARQIWGDNKLPLKEVVIRLTVGVGDLARLGRDGYGIATEKNENGEERELVWRRELKKELGNIIFSTIRWVDDLGLDVLECLDLAIEAQEKFAKSGRPR